MTKDTAHARLLLARSHLLPIILALHTVLYYPSCLTVLARHTLLYRSACLSWLYTTRNETTARQPLLAEVPTRNSASTGKTRSRSPHMHGTRHHGKNDDELFHEGLTGWGEAPPGQAVLSAEQGGNRNEPEARTPRTPSGHVSARRGTWRRGRAGWAAPPHSPRGATPAPPSVRYLQKKVVDLVDIYHFFFQEKKSTTFLSTTFNFRISKIPFFRISIGQSVLNLRDMKQCGGEAHTVIARKNRRKNIF